MSDKTLLRSQKNEVFRLIAKAGLRMDGFSWQEIILSGVKVSRLDYQEGFFFRFDRGRDNNKYWSVFSPGERERTESTWGDNWVDQLSNAEKWTSYLAREFEEPDLWTTINSEKKIAEGAAQTKDNSPFSPDEQRRVAKDVNEIKEFLTRTYSLNQEQAKFVNDRLNYLTEASDRLGRKDWINLTLSVLVTIIMGVAMPPEASRELLRFAGEAFKWLLISPIYLPV